MKEPIYVWGLDISLKSTALTVYDAMNKVFVYTGSFNTEKIYATRENKGLELNAVKLKKLTDWVKEMIKLYPPTDVSIERMFSKRPNETQVIAKATGVVQCMLWNKPQTFYPPKRVKATILHGDATKEDLANAIINTYPDLTFANDDESDSFAVVITHLVYCGLFNWIKPDREYIESLRVPEEPKVKKPKKAKAKPKTKAKAKKKTK